jgi:hypothetical protein
MHEGQPTRREQQRQRRLEKQKAKKRAADVSRRNRRLVIGGLGLVGTAVAGGTAYYALSGGGEMPFVTDNTQSPYLTPTPEVFFEVPIFSPAPGFVPYKEQFDRKHIERTFSDLEKTPGSPKARVDSLLSNLAITMSLNTNNEISGGTAFMIDQGGYFLTCGHVIFDGENQLPPYKPTAAPTLVYHLGLRKAFIAKNIMIDPESDLGVIFAPTQNRPGAIRSLAIDPTTSFQPGLKLWQLGVLTAPDKLQLGIMHGSVDQTPEEPPSIFKDLIRIVGMIPFGGSSGAPIVDELGKIRAVESGLFMDPNETRNERGLYKGATVAPISGMRRLISQGEIHPLPLTA